jgi:hypothetical protein
MATASAELDHKEENPIIVSESDAMLATVIAKASEPSLTLSPSALISPEISPAVRERPATARKSGTSSNLGDSSAPAKNNIKSFLANFPTKDIFGGVDLIPKRLKNTAVDDMNASRDARVAKKMKDIEAQVEDDLKRQSVDESPSKSKPRIIEDEPSVSMSQSTFSVMLPEGKDSNVDPKEILRRHFSRSKSKSNSHSRSYTPSQQTSKAVLDPSYFSRLSKTQDEEADSTPMEIKVRNYILFNKTKFVKHGRYGYPHYRHIHVDIDTGEVSWGKNSRKRENLMNLIEIIEGKESKVFQRKSAETALARRCFTLVFRGNKQLNLEAMSSNQKDEWLACIKDLQRDLILRNVRKGLGTGQAGRISKV